MASLRTPHLSGAGVAVGHARLAPERRPGDEQLGRAWVEFRLNRQGKVAEMEVEGWRAFQKTDTGE